MNWRFYTPDAEEAVSVTPYFSLRPNKTCDSGWLDFFIWTDYYKCRYCILDEKALLIVMKNKGEYFAALPYCKEEDLPHYFAILQSFFNDVLGQPFVIYLADEEGVNLLGLQDDPNYIVTEEEDLKDYLYDGEQLRTLPGKAFQKKRNLIHKFQRDYEGRWEYRTLSCADRTDIEAFLDDWFSQREAEETDGEATLEFEQSGLKQILAECCSMQYKMGGIFLDGKLEALSIGTLNPLENMACISVEKADAEITGLYQMINQQFLLHEFPDATIINREDDVGLEGLRRAKMSYNPIGFEKKYMVSQKNFEGKKVDISDPFEEEIRNYEQNQ